MICLLGIVYAIPASRMSKMLSGFNEEVFSSTRILNYLKLAAKLFEPLYIHFGEVLADLPRLMGDDTNTRVTDMEKAARDGTYHHEPSGMIGRLADFFGRVSPKKKGGGSKIKINISVLAGRSDVIDRRSYIFFFRTHFGNVGNLLSRLLEMRSPKKVRLTFLGDLSSGNLPLRHLAKKFNLVIAGCAAHCRRPFWRYRWHDRQLCYFMARAFLLLSKIEERLDEREASWDMILTHLALF